MLKITGVSKIFGQDQALNDINLIFEEGNTYGLIGPSGCGKSTLLKIIMGLVNPDTGEVHFNGEIMEDQTIQLFRHKMGYVIQEGGLFPHLSVKKNITLMADYLKYSSAEINNRLDYLLDLTQIPTDLLIRFPLQLSGGQRQRISLMRALMLDPKLLLLDEPLGALDPMIRAELQRDLKRIFKKLHKTVLMVTHDMGEAAYFSDQIVLMRNGQIIQQGNLNNLIKNPADDFVVKFINAQRNPLNEIKEK